MVSNAGKYRQLCNRRRRGESWPVVPGTLEFRGIVGEGAASLLVGHWWCEDENIKGNRKSYGGEIQGQRDNVGTGFQGDQQE